MIRSSRVRLGLSLLSVAPVVLIGLSLFGLRYVPEEQAFNIAVATPTVYLAFVFLTVIAPLAAGGGYELYPSEQLVAYPLHPRTIFRGTLLLAPANLAWILNVVALVVITSFAMGPVRPATALGIASALAFIVLATVCGQSLAWWVVGVRQSRTGRWITWTLACVATTATILAIRLDVAFSVLDNSPTKYGLLNAYDGYEHRWGSWLLGLSCMVAGTALAVLIGERAASWALRRPGDHANRDGARPVRRRSPKSTSLRELIAIDRASVWRSLPLRRGILVLLVLPGLVAAIAAMPWQSLILLPGLVAAGAGLLFGINAFALDAGGSTWMSTLPNWPKNTFISKTWVLSEITLIAVAAAILGGSVRSGAPGSAADITAAIGAGVASAGIVVSSGMRASIRYPYRAQLRGSRDTPAPPGVMALHSVKLAVVTTLVSLFFSAAALSATWWLPLVLTIPVLSWSGLRLFEAGRAWEHPHVRAHVVSTVSIG